MAGRYFVELAGGRILVTRRRDPTRKLVGARGTLAEARALMLDELRVAAQAPALALDEARRHGPPPADAPLPQGSLRQ